MPLGGPLVVGFLLAPTPVGILMLVLLGVVVMASMSVTVVMGQSYLPHRKALAAGLMIGFASIGSATPGLAIIGAIADAVGRDGALWVVAAFPVVGGALATLLPPLRERPAAPLDAATVASSGLS